MQGTALSLQHSKRIPDTSTGPIYRAHAHLATHGRRKRGPYITRVLFFVVTKTPNSLNNGVYSLKKVP